jgi:hypothetical protein
LDNTPEPQTKLDRYVATQLHAGTAESTGTFTLSPERAREKMRSFQMANPGSYVVKIVQAAVMGGASAIKVTATRNTLTLEFESEDPLLNSPEQLTQALLTVHALPESPLRHLAVGLNAATSPSLIELRWETPQGSVILTESTVKAESCQSERCRFVVKKKRGLLQWFRGTVYLDEIHTLTSRCGYGPCRIVLDGLPISQPKWDSFHPSERDDIGLGQGDKPPNLLERTREGQGSLLLSQPSERAYNTVGGVSQPDVWKGLADTLGLPLLLHRTREQRIATSGALAIRPVYEGSGWVGFVKHGVFLESREVGDLGHPGAVVLTCADTLTTDLSEFQLVENEVYREHLQHLRQWVSSSTEQLAPETLQAALRAAGLQGSRLESRWKILQHLMRFHQVTDPKTIEGLLDYCFPDGTLHRAPDTPKDKEETVREVHHDHLPIEEAILALYDDTVLGNAKLGFVITANRLCWKGMFAGSQYVQWHELNLEELTVQDNKLEFMNTELSVVLNRHVLEGLERFLKRVQNLNLKPLRRLSAQQQAIVSEAVKALGKHNSVYLHPYLPARKLAAAKLAYGEKLGPDEIPLVLFDDTIFGGGDNGFMVTTRGLHWKNILTDPASLEWSELQPDDISVDSGGVKVKGQSVSVVSADLRKPVCHFFQTVASLAVFAGNDTG